MFYSEGIFDVSNPKLYKFPDGSSCSNLGCQVAWSKNQTVAVSSCIHNYDSSVIQLFDVSKKEWSNGTYKLFYKDANVYTQNLAFSPNGDYLVSSNYMIPYNTPNVATYVSVWSYTQNELIKTDETNLSRNDDSIWPNGLWVSSKCVGVLIGEWESCSLAIYNLDNGTLSKTPNLFQFPNKYIQVFVQLAHDEESLYICSNTKNESDVFRVKLNGCTINLNVDPIYYNSETVGSFAVSPDNTILTLFTNGYVKTVKLENHSEFSYSLIKKYKQPFFSQYSPISNQSYVASLARHGEASMFLKIDQDHPSVSQSFFLLQNFVSFGLSISPTGEQVAVTSQTETLNKNPNYQLWLINVESNSEEPNTAMQWYVVIFISIMSTLGCSLFLLMICVCYTRKVIPKLRKIVTFCFNYCKRDHLDYDDL